MPKLERITETALYADDLEGAEAFYTEVLGLNRVGHEPGRSAFFAVGPNCVLLIFQPDATLKGDHLPPHGARGSVHVAFGVSDDEYEAWRARLAERGVAVVAERAWDRGGRSMYFHDPAGNLLEIATRGIWGLDEGW